MAVGRWTLWTLSTALPFLAGAVFAYLLGLLGIIASPHVPVPPGAMPFGVAAATAVIAVGLVFALAWLLWGRLMRRLRWGVRPDPQVVGLPMLLVLLGVSSSSGSPTHTPPCCSSRRFICGC